MSADALIAATVPCLMSNRLLLRPYRLEDFDGYAAMWSDPLVTRFIGGVPFTLEQSWGRFLRQVGHWPLLGFGYFAIEERSSGRFIGEAGFQEALRDLDPSIEGSLEPGWCLLPEVHGRGYATEAMHAAVTWASATFPGRRMTCIMDPDNAPSRRVAGKLGFAEYARSTYHGAPLVLLEKPVADRSDPGRMSMVEGRIRRSRPSR